MIGRFDPPFRAAGRNKGRVFIVVAIAVMLASFCGCGGGADGQNTQGSNGGGNGSGNGGNGGGSGGPAVPAITLLSPSKLMVGVPLGTVTVYGTNFSSSAQVYIDGAPSTSTSAGSTTQLQAQVSIAFDNTVGTHTFTVVQGSQTSNAATFVVYSPSQGPEPFTAVPAYFPNGANSELMVMCDVNGDGYADAVMPGPTINNTQSLAIMFGQANGQLGPPVFTTGLSVGAMVCGDVMGDGKTDIVTTVAVGSSYIISILVNDGKGNFTQGPTVPCPGPCGASLTLADMTGEGNLDLIFTAPGSLYYVKNEGAGVFATPVSIATPAGDNTSLVVADFNEDGKPDIAYPVANASTGQDQMHLLVNQGGGSFVDEVAPGITGEAGYFAAADFNLDGHTDLAIEQEPPFVSFPVVSVQVYFGQGNGTFVAGPQSTMETNAFQTFQLVAGDFDHDGNPDLAGENGDGQPGHIVLLWGDGTGNFTRQQISGPQGFYLTTGDVNGDGIPDILIPDRFGNISVVLGQTNRSFPAVTSYTPNVAGALSVGDVMGNGNLDLLSPGTDTPFDQTGTVLGDLYVNNGSGQFFIGGAPPSQGMILADMNGDGLADLIGSDGTNILIWQGTGDANFASGNPITIAPPAGVTFGASAMQIADMDGDGRPDIVMPNVILYNQGNFTFTAVQVTFCTVSPCGPFVIGDFNRDGLLDIATGNGTLLGQQGRTFREVAPNGLNMTYGNFATVGDLNQDGFPDVVFGGNGDPLVIEYGNGDGTFYEQSMLNVGPVSDFSQAIVVADVNGDGFPDIVACLFLSEQCAIYTNDRQGGFQRSYFASGAGSTQLLAAPFTSNGTPSLAITNYNVDYAPPNFLVALHK